MHLEIAGHILDLCNYPDDVLRALASTVLGAPRQTCMSERSEDGAGALV
jgi:hypothetical protein